MFRVFAAIAASLMMALLPGCATSGTSEAPDGRPVIAITVDDIPEHAAMATGETRLDLSRRLVGILQAEAVPAYGFVNGSRAIDPDSIAALEHWAAAFPVGNHSWSHPNLNDVSVERFAAEIADNEPLLQRLSRGQEWRWFRYPFLAEGNDPEKRLAIRRVLADRGYRIAAVTMDFSDWAYNGAYARCAAKADNDAIRSLEEDWLAAVRHEAGESQRIAKALYGKDIPYVLLTHLGSFDARIFARTIALYREMGFDFVSLEEAQRHPAYSSDNDPSLAPAPSVWAQLEEKGLPAPSPRASTVNLATICS
jgi:peptidoglycan-N-acetylglucosamine deacetylase